MPKFKVRIEQKIPEVSFEIIEAETTEDAMDKAHDSGGPYETGDGFDYDGEAGITDREVVSAELIAEVTAITMARCDDCQQQWPVSQLNEPKRLHERLDHPPGHPDRIEPAGECPGCGALAYTI